MGKLLLLGTIPTLSVWLVPLFVGGVEGPLATWQGSWGPTGVGRRGFGVGRRAWGACCRPVSLLSFCGLHLPERDRLRERERDLEWLLEDLDDRLRDDLEELWRRRRRSRDRDRVRERRRRDRDRERERRPPLRYLPPRPLCPRKETITNVWCYKLYNIKY